MNVFFTYREPFYPAFAITADRVAIGKSISPTQQVLYPFPFPRTPKPACDPPPVFSNSGSPLGIIPGVPRHFPYNGVLVVGFVHSVSFPSSAKTQRHNLRVRPDSPSAGLLETISMSYIISIYSRKQILHKQKCGFVDLGQQTRTK